VAAQPGRDADELLLVMVVDTKKRREAKTDETRGLPRILFVTELDDPIPLPTAGQPIFLGGI